MPNTLVSKVYDVTLDGISGGSFSSEATWTERNVRLGNVRVTSSSKLSSFLSFNVEFTKTRKELVVKLKDAQRGVDIIFRDSGVVTFEPKKVRTDRNGRAVTYVAFEEGFYDASTYINVEREVLFQAYGTSGVSANITFDGASRNLSSTVSYPLDIDKTREKLVVKIKGTQQRMDIAFHSIRGSTKFEPQKVRADTNGRAVTYITFEEGLRDVEIGVDFGLNILDKNQYGANVYSYSDGHKAVLIKGLELRVRTSVQYDNFTNRKYLPPRDSKHFTLYGQGITTNYCGQTSARMVLNYYGVDVSLRTFNKVIQGNDWLTKTFGTRAPQMRWGLNLLLPVEVDQYEEGAKGSSRPDFLRDKISKNRPPILLVRVVGNAYHYFVVVGYDTKHNKFLIADPGGEGGFYWEEWQKLKGWWSFSGQIYTDDEADEALKNMGAFKAWFLSGGGEGGTNRFLRSNGYVAPYRIFVPKVAPPYHHLESQTVTTSVRVKRDVLFSPERWRKTLTFNGTIVNVVAAITGEIGGPLTKIESEGNRTTIYGLTGRTQVGIYAPLIVTAWYKPGAAAAPVLALPPGTTALLPNYPNPFNPETWIPYHLAEPADVRLTIYGIDGKVVRRLDLGHQAAGFYQSKSRAAYWDGRNDVGERVASGIYFYTLTAGEFAATQKMLILK